MILKAKITILIPILLIPLGILLLALSPNPTPGHDSLDYIGVTCISISAGSILVIIRYFEVWFPDNKKPNDEVVN